MEEDRSPWDGPGVGYTEGTIHPVRKVMSILQDEMVPEDLVTTTTLLKDKITRATWEHVLPRGSFDDEARGDVELKKSKLFHALEVQYSLNVALEMLRSVALSENLHISLNARNIPIATLIENVLKDEKEYYEKHGLGELDRIHFVGRKSYIKKIQKDLENDEVCGILICGMYGMGKTTLAKKICKSAMSRMELRYVDLRNIKTEEGAFHGIMSGLTGQKSFDYDKVHLQYVIENLGKKMLLLLDNADTLMDFGAQQSHHRKRECERFHALLKLICLQKNPNLKIVLTSRFKLTTTENMTSETTKHKFEKRFDGAVREYMITPLEQPDAMKLLDHELNTFKEKISYNEKAELVEACGYSPMAIQLAASQLKNNMNTTIAELLTKRAQSIIKQESGAQSVTTEFALGSILQEGSFMHSILEEVFNSLEFGWKTKLMRLSVLESAFDVHAAAACMRSDTTVEATLDLQYLLCRHLVEVTDISTTSGTVNLYKEGDVRYVIHTLTAQYLRNLQSEEKWRAPLKKAQKRFAAHYRDRLYKIQKGMTKKNALTIFHELDEIKSHLQKMLFVEIDLGIVPRVERKIQLRAFHDMPGLYKFFQNQENRKEYYSVQASKALTNKDYGSYCTYVLWEIDLLIELNHIRETQQNLDQVAQVMQQHEGELKKDEKQFKSIQANFCDKKGRYLHKIAQYDEAVKMLRKSAALYKDVLGASVTTAQAINMLGAAYFAKGNYEKANEHHSEAFGILSSVTDSTSPHFDTPVYLMNIGTVCQIQARKEKTNGFWRKAEEGLRKAVTYYDRSLDAYRKLNMYGSRLTIEILKNKGNAKFDLEDYKEALKIANEVWVIVNKTMENLHPMKGLHIAWVGTMYYDYAENVLAKGTDSKECTRTYVTAEQKLHEAAIHIRANDNVPMEDPSYMDLKKFTRKVLKKLGKHEKLQKFENKMKEYEEKRAKMRIARNLAPLKLEEDETSESGSDTSDSDADSQDKDERPVKVEPEVFTEPEDDLMLTPGDLHIQHQVAFDSEVVYSRSGVKRPHPSTDSSESSDSERNDDQSSSSDEEETPRWQTCVIF